METKTCAPLPRAARADNDVFPREVVEVDFRYSAPPPRADRPLMRFEGVSIEIERFVVPVLNRRTGKMERPYLITAIDRQSGLIVGYRIVGEDFPSEQDSWIERGLQ